MVLPLIFGQEGKGLYRIQFQIQRYNFWDHVISRAVHLVRQFRSNFLVLQSYRQKHFQELLQMGLYTLEQAKRCYHVCRNLTPTHPSYSQASNIIPTVRQLDAILITKT